MNSARDTDTAFLSVRPSARRTLVLYETASRCIVEVFQFNSRLDRPIILVFSNETWTWSPLTATSNTRVVSRLRDLLPINSSIQ